jgi:Fe/S biogenesis protein NfuA
MDEKETDEIKAKVQKILDEMINPAVSSHGGWVDLLDIKDNLVYLRLGGGCQGCGMVNVTLKQGIEATIREEIPQIAGVVDQTDHQGGNNPYYQPAK